MSNPIMRYPPHTLVPHDAELVLASDYDALAARLAEARRDAFQAALDCMTDRQARDHLSARLQDVYGVWWHTPDSADARRCFKCGHAAHDGDCVNTAPEQPSSVSGEPA